MLKSSPSLLLLLLRQLDKYLEVEEAGLEEGESVHQEEADLLLLADWRSQIEQCKSKTTRPEKTEKHFSLKTSNHCKQRSRNHAS